MQTTDAQNAVGMEEEAPLVFSPDHALSKLYARWLGEEKISLHVKLRPEGSLRYPLDHEEAKRLEWLLAEAVEECYGKNAVFPDAWDEKAIVYLSKDRMAAWLLLIPPAGEGHDLTPLALEQQVADQGAIHGVDEELIAHLLDLPDRHFCLFLIARGTPPVHGKDGYVIDRIPRETRPSAKLGELAKADYNMLHLVRKIEKGDVICEIVQATKATDGVTVSGEIIPGKVGVKPEIPSGRNTKISEDGRFLIAVRSGHVEFSGMNFLVKPVLEIQGNVDNPTADVNFLGDVHIHGDVTNGCTVRAMGNIQIDGSIEICSIEAGENLIVSSGVQGQDQTVLRAHKSVFAKYLEHCAVYARNSVEADCIIDCEICSNGDVRVRTGRGAIIGGIIRAAREVTADIIGSKAEHPTAIILGGLPCERYERRQILDELEESKKDLERLRLWAHVPEKQKEIAFLETSIRVARLKLERFEKEYEAYFQAQSGKRRRLYADVVYPGTEVRMDDFVERILYLERGCRIAWINGRMRRI